MRAGHLDILMIMLLSRSSLTLREVIPRLMMSGMLLREVTPREPWPSGFDGYILPDGIGRDGLLRDPAYEDYWWDGDPITLYMTRMVTWRSKMHTIMIHLKRRQRLMTALRIMMTWSHLMRIIHSDTLLSWLVWVGLH